MEQTVEIAKRIIKNPKPMELLVFGVVIWFILLIDIKDGSSHFRVFEILHPKSMATKFMNFSFLGLVITLILLGLKGWKTYQLFGVLLLISGALYLVEPRISSLQYESTKRSLITACESIRAFKIDEGKYPEKFEELIPKYIPAIPKSSFGVWGNLISYEKLDDDRFILSYRVKYGYGCESFNCSSGILSSPLTFTTCVHYSLDLID